MLIQRNFKIKKLDEQVETNFNFHTWKLLHRIRIRNHLCKHAVMLSLVCNLWKQDLSLALHLYLLVSRSIDHVTSSVESLLKYAKRTAGKYGWRALQVYILIILLRNLCPCNNKMIYAQRQRILATWTSFSQCFLRASPAIGTHS